MSARVYAQAEGALVANRSDQTSGLLSPAIALKGLSKEDYFMDTASLISLGENKSENEQHNTALVSLLLSRSFSSLRLHRQLQQEEKFTSGSKAVLDVAAGVSDTVFVYELLDTVSEDQPSNVVKLELRNGAASVARGALAVGSDVSALIPSQSLPLFLPNIFQIGQCGQACVFHVACENIRRDLAVGSTYESIYALQHAGAILLNSSTPQECHDVALISHIAALRLKKPIVHFYDGTRVGRQQAKLNVLSEASLAYILNSEKNAKLPADELRQFGHGNSQQDLALQVQYVMDDLFPVLRKQYKVYEYFGATDAEYVIVVVGEASGVIQEALAYEQMLGAKVGVIQVRTVLPWSHVLFAAALPSTVKRVAVLENISSSAFTRQQGLLSQNVHVFFHSNYWCNDFTPLVLTGLYGGIYGNWSFSAGMARSVFHHLANATTRRGFVIAKSEALYEQEEEQEVASPLFDIIYGESFEFGADPYTKQFLFWGFDTPQTGEDLLDEFQRSLDLLNKNPNTQVHAFVNHSSLNNNTNIERRPISTLEVRLSPNSLTSGAFHQPIDQSDVSFVLDTKLLETYDVFDSIRIGGTLLVNAPYKTFDDLELSKNCKVKLAKREIQLQAINLEEVSGRVDVESVAKTAVQIAFLKAAGLFSEQVIYALLQADIPEDLHNTLRSFVSTVWSETIAINYNPSEWTSSVASVLEEEDETEIKPLSPSLDSLQVSTIAHSKAGTGMKRPRYVSNETKTAWKFIFPDHFKTRQNVRDHVTSLVKVTKWERLTPLDYSRNVWHMEMDITNTDIKYKIGEALAVFAHNDEKEVINFLRLYNLHPEQLVNIPVKTKADKTGDVPVEKTEETVTYFQLFAQVLDIFGRPSKKFYEALAERATDEKEKETLTHLLSAEGKEEYKKRVDETLTFADLLVEFASARPSVDELIQLVPRIKPRHYSIASSMKMNPTSVHLLIVLHDWTTPSGKYRIGQATRFLSSIREGQMLSVSVCSSVMKLPVNHEDPVIMAGLGTGMAPFRAFIQERAYLKLQGVKVGPMALYFGSRHKAKEYLYGNELDAYEKDGLLTYLRCAFSRDQAHKVYIQDKIAEDKMLLHDLLLQKNGHFYLCGPTWPVADVREALIQSFSSEGGLDRKQANATIENMREEGRYVLEVY
jgi:sulfite reductase (NADPH) flavoprotein alpha-component